MGQSILRHDMTSEACNNVQDVERNCELFSFNSIDKIKERRIPKEYLDSFAAAVKATGDSIHIEKITEIVLVNAYTVFFEGLWKVFSINGLHVCIIDETVVGYVFSIGKRYVLSMDWARGFKVQQIVDETGLAMNDLVESCRFLDSPCDAQHAIVQIERLGAKVYTIVL